ncbi:MAG TPA: LamG-like jellyroll fold domain-containing protein [Tepidisphaeraceae bacterium]|nr:LamG-like jellyroll fold domain-containing protein [Tepidisphaeraceae bacterium]
MTLSDKEILELSDLCSAVVDETLTDKQKQRLSKWLVESEEVRRHYVRALGLSASLHSYASEMHTEAPDSFPMPPNKRRWKWVVGLLSIAAMFLTALWIRLPSHDTALAQTPSDDEFVAQLTGSRQCVWGNGHSILPGAQLRKMQRIELAKGFAEITFDCGAQVVLEGPASLDLSSAWSATLNRGTLRASLPPEAMGFSISNPTVEVVDLGTEFTMFADASGTATDVLVLKGEVEAAPNAAGDQQPIVIREKEARRFATNGVWNLHDSEPALAEMTQPVPLDHYATPTSYAHWSFDEVIGNVFKADAMGHTLDEFDAQLENLPPTGMAAGHAKGRVGSAIHFDGHLFARAAFPGISDNSPHTVLFWVKVPRDATLSNAYAMVGWGVSSKLLRSHPIHIAWNRNPNEGTVGVLRTDYGGGFAVGATPLRDGRWHHIAVVFIPRDDPRSPMAVKQYVDGRLEGEGHPSPPGSDRFMGALPYQAQTTNGAIWLGCRLGIEGVRADRFYGDMDELYIVNCALEPAEIVRLMDTNQLQFDTDGMDDSDY